jgi:peptidoglycan L-alanyl-D-glutamate endopeptidase CwlK
MGFQLGKNSSERLDTCHIDLQKIVLMVISITNVDFGIAEGHRPVSKQQEYYAIGRTVDLHRAPITNIDGVNKKGKHNIEPSEAVDIYIWHPVKSTRLKIAYDKMHLSYVVGIFDACADVLLERGEITHKIRWGANWDSDGIIDYDQKFDDFPHIELVKI